MSEQNEAVRLLFKQAMDWGRSYGQRLNLSDITIQDVSQGFTDLALRNTTFPPSEGVNRLKHLRTISAGRIYIAGPMTGIAEHNFPAFNAKAADLRALGWHVENPAEHGFVEGAEWADYMCYDLSRMVTCNDIYLLKGWSRSRGACCELRTAWDLGMSIQYEPGAEQVPLPVVITQPMQEVLQELERAKRKFPTWPTDPLHALAVLGEEFGELTKDMLQLTYEPHKTSRERVRTEALQTAAMALRLFMSLDRYAYEPGEQHSQEASHV